MLIDIVKVTPFPDFTLELEYANGETRCFDAKPLLTVKPWIALNSWGLFQRARAQYGTVTWPGNLDIAPETLYDRSIPVGHGQRETVNVR